VADKFSTREHYKYLAPFLEPQAEKFGYKGFNLAYLNKPVLLKYDRTKPIVFLRIYSSDKVDAVIKQVQELSKLRPQMYVVIAVEKVTKDNIRAFLMQRPMCKNMNIVQYPNYEESSKILQKGDVQEF
jgi:hypothetical protein